MRFVFYSDVHFEKWSWRNSTEGGIGGSETCHVELCRRLAARGHEVVSYSPLPPDETERDKFGVQWRDLSGADFSLGGVWVVFRNAECVDRLAGKPSQRIWLMCQDEVPINLTPERCNKLETVIALCKWHAAHMVRAMPFLRNKISVWSNGIKMDLVREAEADAPPRNPKRMIFASSPDRGFVPLAQIFSRVREYVPDAELHVFYGLDNMDKLADRYPHMRGQAKRIRAAADAPGVTWHGRTSQRQLYREMLASGIWCYPNTYNETSCIQCMEQQALGCVPVARPYAALAENVRHGVFVPGDPNEPLTQARYVNSIVALMQKPELQEQIRGPMMLEARMRYNWERQVDHMEAWAHDADPGRWRNQFAFQLKHARGAVVNIGCNTDPAGFKEQFGALNIDILATDPNTGWANRYDILADARHLPSSLTGSFDTAVLGDILEHFTPADMENALREARKTLRPGGRVVLTCPDDDRPHERQHSNNGGPEYVPGVSAFHDRRIPREELVGACERAGLTPVLVQELDYTHFTGHGIVAEAAA